MGLEGIVWKLYDMSSWLMKIIVLNLLWFIFTIAGLVVFGIFPATAAMFSVTRKWMMGDTDIPVFQTFWNTYKTSFLQINIIGSTIVLIGAILYIDLRFFQTSEHVLLSFLAFFIIFALFIYFAVVLYIFPLYVHFQLNTMEYLKKTLILVIGKPIHTIMMIVGCYLVYVVLSMIPYLIIFFGASSLSLVLTWVAMLSFPRHEYKAGEVE